MNKLFIKFSKFFKKSNNLDHLLKKNISLLFTLKGASFLVSFLMVPLLLNYLDNEQYGIWLVLSSIVGWVTFFDLGIGNVIRNELGKAWSNKNYISSKKIVSTSYAIIFTLILFLNIAYWSINPFVDWIDLLNIKPTLFNEIRELIPLMFMFISFRMVVGLIVPILFVDHKPVIAELIVFSSNLLSFFFILFIQRFTNNSIFIVGISSTFFSTITPLISSIYLFKKRYKLISPSFSQIDTSLIKTFLKQGFQFSTLQMSLVVLTMTDMIIISNLYGPEEVVPYSVSFKLFSYVTIFFGVIMTPFWAIFNEAYNNNKFDLIKRAIKKLFLLWIFLVLGVLLLIFISDYIYLFWVGEEIAIPIKLSIVMGIFVTIQILNTILTTFIYSTGKLVIQTLTGILVAAINIPLCIIFSKGLDFGVTGITIASVICSLFTLTFCFIQYTKIVNRNDYGIWSI